MKKLLINILVVHILSILISACSTSSQTDYIKIQYLVPSDLDRQNEPAYEVVKVHHASDNELSNNDINKLSNEQYQIVRYIFSTSIKYINKYRPNISKNNKQAIWNINKMIEGNDNSFLTNEIEKDKWVTIVKSLRKMQGFDKLDNTTFLKRHKNKIISLMVNTFKSK